MGQYTNKLQEDMGDGATRELFGYTSQPSPAPRGRGARLRGKGNICHLLVCLDLFPIVRVVMIVDAAVSEYSSKECNIGYLIFCEFSYFQMKMLAILFLIGNPFFIACKLP